MVERKMSKLPEDLRFGRETIVKIPRSGKAVREVFAACIKTDDEELLVPTKIYKVKLAGDRAIVVDEEGEVAVYPMDFFLVLSLTPSAKSTLAAVMG